MARLIRVLLAAGLSMPMALPAAAQASATRGVTYRLDDGATFQRGCFGPCACPVGVTAPIRGTFRLIPDSSDPLFVHCTVANVLFKVSMPDGTVLPVTGSGTFTIGGEVAITEALSLDLAVGTDPVEHFDSGLVVPSVPFPVIDLEISIHGAFCFDTVIRVRARPAPRLDVGRDAIDWDLDPADSAFDAVRGDLAALRGTAGDYRAATVECIAADVPVASVPWTLSPTPGGMDWFLVRPHAGSYDAWDSTPVAPRDAGIDAAAGACP
jgi:hypothetical protein